MPAHTFLVPQKTNTSSIGLHPLQSHPVQTQSLDTPPTPTPHSSNMNTQPFPAFEVHETTSPTDFFPRLVIDSKYSWGQKVCDELNFSNFDSDVSELSHSYMNNDENTPIIDLRQYSQPEQVDNDSTALAKANRRLSESESSYSMSSTGGIPEMPTYEELATSEGLSYNSDMDGWGTSEPSSTMFSPLASPRRSHHDVIRNRSSRASPAPHSAKRASPYTLDGNRGKRWSAPSSQITSGSRNIAQTADRFATYAHRLNAHHSLPAYPLNTIPSYQAQTQNMLFPHSHQLQSTPTTLFSSPEQPFHLEVPRPVPSQGLFRLLQSNADKLTGCSSHFADMSDPPDLYSSLHETPSDPPEEDMHPSDPDLIPHEQDLRFSGDLYTPKWVRGHGNKREGWCGLCKPGRWLVLKNSAFWYDKSFTHGVSAATGAAFQGPQDTRRTEGNLDVWEGLCGSCGDWIALVSSKKKGTTWFRHAYKCHTHPKVKDGPKRRRETSHTLRARALSSASAASSSFPVKEPVRDIGVTSLASTGDLATMTMHKDVSSTSLSETAHPAKRIKSEASTDDRLSAHSNVSNVKTISPLSSLAGLI
ncbi:hypothetical protein M501DRAFT_943456 [Patellaria atrata CBS 101060]|uniref:Transcription regulator Rua1 C-terminal domain-containing protein n=1 Tax=Patellaria atrata CBS 101060 TaxID=1346257 RepID=A0A9P4S3N7_9PEZI|nr:hypothetical protein M501DRAFT_943456 [Patellaria atrata CBS 101060]